MAPVCDRVQAEVIGSFLRLLDPDDPPLQLEIAPANTWESAQAVRELLPESTHRIVLASSALHLPRAMLAFEQAAKGFQDIYGRGFSAIAMRHLISDLLSG